MTIGSFGDIVFQVSEDLITTLSDFKRNSKANFSEHKIVGQPAVLEFLGRDLEEISFTAIFSKSLGHKDLLQEVHKFREKLWNGTAEFFILSNHAYSEHKMVVTSLSEAVEYFDARGAHQLVKIDVTLKEYVEHLNE